MRNLDLLARGDPADGEAVFHRREAVLVLLVEQDRPQASQGQRHHGGAAALGLFLDRELHLLVVRDPVRGGGDYRG